MIETRLARVEARLDASGAAGAPARSAAPTQAQLTTAQRAALVAAAARLAFYRTGKVANLPPGGGALDFWATLTPEQKVALQDVEAGMRGGTLGVKWPGLRGRMETIMLDLATRWGTPPWNTDPMRSLGVEYKPMMDAIRNFETALELGTLADLPQAFAAWERAARR